MIIFDKRKSRIKKMPVTFRNEKLPGFNVISDLHVDFYLSKNDINNSMENFIKKMMKNCEILEDVLLIGGDLGNHNSISLMFLEKIKDYWKYILLIPGNHDWYNQEKTENRYKDLIKKVKEKNIKNIIFLQDEVEIFSYNGINYGGSTLMYNLYDEETLRDFRLFMNDKHFISEDFIKKKHDEDLRYYERVIDKVDVFLSHVPVYYVKSKRGFKHSQLFHNTEVKLQKHILYIQGHAHDFKIASDGKKNGICAINTALGYPFENDMDKPFLVTVKIKNL